MSNQCIVSSVVYDWLTFDECIKKTKLIPDVAKCILDDCICINFNLNCANNEPTVIWKSIGMVVNKATFSIKHCGTCDSDFTILVNDEIVATIPNGSTFETEVRNLNSISVIRDDNCIEDEICCGELVIQVYYVAAEIDRKDLKIECYLSNKKGEPIDTINGCGLSCKEIGTNRRISKSFMFADCELVELNKVTLLIEGFITIKISKGKDKCLLLCTIPISVQKCIFLCAPPGTEIKCKIYHFDCDVKTREIKDLKGCLEAIIHFEFCVDIKSVYQTVINIDADYCEPRDDLSMNHSFCID